MTRVVSSPAARCTATVEPLAEEAGVPVETSGSLREGRGDRALDLVLDMVEDAALCTHGDVIEEVLAGLRALGWAVPPEPAAAKGSTWVLSRGQCSYIEAPV